LLEILMQDSITQSLLRKNHYTISLNSDFQLKINNLSPVEESKVEDSSSGENGTNNQ